MIEITCNNDNIASLGKKLQQFAFTQDGEGKIDLTPGRKYTVYGHKTNRYGEFVLILTDTIHTSTPWWMPVDLFDTLDYKMPASWTEKSYGIFSRTQIAAPSPYFEGMEDIEDGTQRGIEIFSRMKN